MQDFGSTVLTCTPSYALFIHEVMEEMGVVPQTLNSVWYFGAEPWSENMRREIENKLRLMPLTYMD